MRRELGGRMRRELGGKRSMSFSERQAKSWNGSGLPWQTVNLQIVSAVFLKNTFWIYTSHCMFGFQNQEWN
jgi:hypothetical protein